MTPECLDTLQSAFVNEIPKYVGSATLLLFGWLIGMRITHYWSIRRTKRELDIEASKTFQTLYGEFFAIWKLWNYYRRDVGKENFPADLWWKVMDRASTAEGKLESLLVGIACERVLSKEDIRTLGLFRQGYQQLRESIRDNEPLNWNSSKDPEYVEFKSLSPKVQKLLLLESSLEIVDPSMAAKQLKLITSNDWEREWEKIKTNTLLESDA